MRQIIALCIPVSSRNIGSLGGSAACAGSAAIHKPNMKINHKHCFITILLLLIPPNQNPESRTNPSTTTALANAESKKQKTDLTPRRKDAKGRS